LLTVDNYFWRRRVAQTAAEARRAARVARTVAARREFGSAFRAGNDARRAGFGWAVCRAGGGGPAGGGGLGVLARDPAGPG